MTAQPRTQMFRPGELPLVVLAILSGAPRNGYELLSELERLFSPDYRPSPGSIYPALKALVTEKLIRPRASDGRKAYELTASGRSALQKRAAMLAEIEVRTGARVAPANGLAPALERFNARVMALSGLVDAAEVDALLDQTAATLERRTKHRELS